MNAVTTLGSLLGLAGQQGVVIGVNRVADVDN